MPNRVCFVYIWATSGGVERVFLNRGEALLRRYPKLEIEVYFYDDCGGGALFQRYISARNLTGRLKVTKTFDPSRYDAVFAVDTPRVLAEHPSIQNKLFMECHTHYANHRAYLREWQHELKTLVVPFGEFLRVIEAEYPGLRGKIKVLRNFVPDLPPTDLHLQLPAWRSPLFLYFGRIDEYKNFVEFVAALSYARDHLPNQPLGIVCGPVVADYPLREVIEKHKARGLIAVLPPVPSLNRLGSSTNPGCAGATASTCPHVASVGAR